MPASACAVLLAHLACLFGVAAAVTGSSSCQPDLVWCLMRLIGLGSSWQISLTGALVDLETALTEKFADSPDFGAKLEDAYNLTKSSCTDFTACLEQGDAQGVNCVDIDECALGEDFFWCPLRSTCENLEGTNSRADFTCCLPEHMHMGDLQS